MAIVSRKVSRKELRQPDWFQTSTERMIDYVGGHRAAVLAGLVALLVIVAIVIGWRIFKENQNHKASEEFARAINLYQGEKYREAIPVLESVASYRWSYYAVLAHIYLANSYLASKEIDHALSAAQRALAATRPNSFYRQIALVTLATAEEQKNDCKTAVQHYSEAQNIPGALQGRALLGKARCSEALGDDAAAVAAYKEYLTENPASFIAIKLAELESKVPPPAPSTSR